MRLLLCCLLAAALGAPAWAGEADADAVPPLEPSTAPWVGVIFPEHGQRYPYVERSFTLGHVTPGSTLTVNGELIQPHSRGGFFSMVGFSTGTFALDYDVVWEGQFASTRVVVEVGPPHGLPETGPDEVAALEPGEDLELRAGDVVTVRCKGPPGLEGSFGIRGLARGLPMAESRGPVPGVYEGHYLLQPGDKGKDMRVSCALRRSFWSRLRAETPGKLTVADPRMTRTAVTTGKTNVLKSREGGYSLFFPEGVKLEVVGRMGDRLRVRLSEHEEGWITASSVELLPEGTPPPRGEAGLGTNIIASSDVARVRIRMAENLPFEIRHTIDPLAFEIRFFGAYHHFDRIRYDSEDAVVRDITWRQESSRVARVSVATRLKWGWGYDAFYADGYFTLDIRRPPDLTDKKKGVLEGRRIVIDPGHGPWRSAVGPRGTTERDVNLAIGLRLRDLLLDEGAEPYMTRTSSDGPSLVDRAFLARDADGDLFISIHNNAFPVTADPFEKPRGYMNFYYQPHSRPLVGAVHASYGERHPDLADEFVRWGNLYVCRMTWMPAILTESAYMSFPGHEERLRRASFQKKLAATMLEGVRAYLEMYRRIQLRSRTERDAAAHKVPGTY